MGQKGNAPESQPLKDAIERRLVRFDPQRIFGLLVETVLTCFSISLEIGVPPFQDPFLGNRERLCRREPVAFLKVDPVAGGKKVPEVVAGPCRPRETVVDVPFVMMQSFPGPNAKKTSF